MRTFLLLMCILSVTFSAKAQLFGRDWSEGRVYDLSNKRFNGFVAWTPPEPTFSNKPGDKLYFKETKKKTEIEVPSSKIRAFVMGTDSFVVSHHPELAQAPFLAVKIDKAMKLFTSRSGRTSAPVSSGMGTGVSFHSSKIVYYYGADADMITRLDKGNFIEVMSRIMSDKPEVVAKIKDKTYKYGDMLELLTFYRVTPEPVHTNSIPY